MIGSVFDASTRRFLIYGELNPNKPGKVDRLAAGNLFVENVNGGGPQWKKLDAQGNVVIDTDRINEYQAGKDQREQVIADGIQAFQELRDFDHTSVDWSVPNQIRMAFEYKRVRDLKISKALRASFDQ